MPVYFNLSSTACPPHPLHHSFLPLFLLEPSSAFFRLPALPQASAMPVAALHPPPVAVGAGRRSCRRQARWFALRASSLEASSAAVTVAVNGTAAAGAAVEKVQEDNEGLSVKEDQDERGLEVLYDDGFGSVTVKDYFAAAKVLCSRDDGGPPRWFSPVECGRPAVDDAPLLLFLPGACVRPFISPAQINHFYRPTNVDNTVYWPLQEWMASARGSSCTTSLWASESFSLRIN